MTDVFDFSVPAADGTEQPLGTYRGDVLLIVNVASECGFTPQYEGLQALQEQFAGRGFHVLGFPCNQFGRQEPGDAEAIQACGVRFGVEFPVFAKIEVNGEVRTRCTSTSSSRPPAHWARRGSSGTSPSFWSVVMAPYSTALRPSASRRTWPT